MTIKTECKTAQLRFAIKDVYPDRFAKLVELRKACEKFEAELRHDFFETEHFAFVKAVQKGGSGGYPQLDLNGDYFVCSVAATFEIDQPHRWLNVSDSVINQLLNGKLLSREEKRDLLRQRGMDLAKEGGEDAKQED